MTLSQLPILLILLPLLGGILTLFSRPKGIQLQRLVSLVFTTALLLLSIYTVTIANSGDYSVYLLGNWTAPFGIVMVLDRLSSLMILLTAILAIIALGYAIAQGTDKKGQHFHVLYQIQLFGLNGAFLTGDLFNLFVFFEVLLLASYGLLLHGGGRLRTKGGLHYVVINLVGSSLFLFAVGTLYGILGTLNIADMSMHIAQLDSDDQGIVAAAGLLLLVVFGIKAAIFPLYLWLPGAYANTSAAVAALFAIMTKVGLYAIIRVHGTLFSEQADALSGLHADVVLTLGLVTLGMAVLGVFASRALKEQTAFLILASVSTLLIGIGINTTEALAATFYYLIHSTLIGAGLFLIADVIARARGSYSDRLRPGAPMKQAILLGSVFFITAIAIVGMPPLSGFIGKVMILEAALSSTLSTWIYAIILVGSLLMIMAMARSGSILFYQTDSSLDDDSEKLNISALALALVLVFASPVLVIAAGPIADFTQSVASQLNNHQAYIDAVMNQPSYQGGK